VIVVLPTAAELARPLDPNALLIVATDIVEDAQATDPVRFWVELSVYTPVAVNCCVRPLATLGVGGVTSIETSVAGDTVNVVLPETVPRLAAIVVLPTVVELARPLDPAALLIVATDVVADDQVTVVVRSCIVLSVYTPVAVNCFVRPAAMVGVAGVTPIETSAAGVTVTDVLPAREPRVAATVVVPGASADNEPVLLTGATVELVELHVTWVVRFWVVLSEKTPVAVNCWVTPLARLGVGGVIWMELRIAVVTVSVVLPEIP
jgi:hypothetical protein